MKQLTQPGFLHRMPVLAFVAVSLVFSGSPSVQVLAAEKDTPRSNISKVSTVGEGSEVVVLAPEESIPWLVSLDWWGEAKRGAQLQAPHVLITGIDPEWRNDVLSMPVEEKKEFFYRFLLPLVLHANQMVLDRRSVLQRAQRELAADNRVSPNSLQWIQRMAFVIPRMDQQRTASLTVDDPELADLIEELLYRIDIVPPSLALGQAAYESGYGTSRFAVEGNALFGQWTYGGDGMVPQQQRKSSKGDHRIKTFDWPFDSVRGYYINLMSHRAYEDFRRLRAGLRAAGKPMDGLTLADGLMNYSERGQEYVDTLKGIIRFNGLDIADDAVLREGPILFLVGVGDNESKAQIEAEIDELRASGELEEIISSMQLD